MKLINHFKHLHLTPSQAQVLASLEEFLIGDNQVFLLKGYAGTGKTTITKGLCEYLDELKLDYSLMAPTGRAAMIMKQKTGKPASTIHKSIYNLDVFEEVDDGNSFKFRYALRENILSQKGVCIVDESSMISDKYSDDEFFIFGSGCLLSDLIKYTFYHGEKRKLILIGDQAQLPPINMSISPAMDMGYLNDKFQLSVVSAELTDVIRQKSDSILLQNATQLRDAISQRVFNSFQIKEDANRVKHIDSDTVLSTYAETAKISGIENTIVITHSNKQALSHNQSIRSLRFKKEPEIVEAKDRMMISRNNYNYEIELFNGLFCVIEEVGNVIYEPEVRFYVKGKEVVTRKLSFRNAKISVTDINGLKKLLNVCLIENFIIEQSSKADPYLERAIYVDFKNRMANSNIKSTSEVFKQKMKTDQFLNALFLKYGYAITCHKAQGGEWDNVFVDFKIFIGKTSESYFRWVYTAITRSKSNLFAIDAPVHNALSKFIIAPIKPISKIPQNLYYIPKSSDKELSFIDWRVERLKKMFIDNEIKATFHFNEYQILLIAEKENDKSEVQLWYGTQGFTKTIWKSSKESSLSKLLAILLFKSLVPDNIPYEPRFDFQKDLHAFLLEKLDESGIQLLNIIQKEWSDIYFIYTGADACSLEFFFDKKHFYSNLIPSSTLGKDDEKLNSLINLLQQP
jgi:tRNA A37 threonylcarbamoyladenosine biosynthesis protein TsaE